MSGRVKINGFTSFVVIAVILVETVIDVVALVVKNVDSKPLNFGGGIVFDFYLNLHRFRCKLDNPYLFCSNI